MDNSLKTYLYIPVLPNVIFYEGKDKSIGEMLVQNFDRRKKIDNSYSREMENRKKI